MPNYSWTDPQTHDPDAYNTDAYLEKVGELYECLDNATTIAYMALEEHENKNIRDALGAIRRALEYVEKEQ